MLNSLQAATKHGFTRIIVIFLMLLLVASFALFGIQDVFRNFSDRNVAIVGSRTISMDTFQTVFRNQLQDYSQRGGSVITPQIARQVGLDRRILDDLIANDAIDLKARAMGVSLSPMKVADLVQADPTFRFGGESFNPAMFQRYLQATRQSEASFVADQRAAYERRSVQQGLFGSLQAPITLIQAMDRFSNETRDIAFIAVNEAQLGPVAAPEASALSTYFADHMGEFRAPEYRSFSYVAATPKDIASRITVSDEDALKTYEANKVKRYTTAETRAVEQIAFPNAADAKAAADRVAAGSATFDAIAAERGLKPADVQLGTLTRDKLIDPVIADAAFSLGEGKISGVVAGKVSPVMLRITKISPQVVQSFDAVKASLKDSMALQRASAEINELRKTVDDERIGGAPLKEVAPKLGLPLQTVTDVGAGGVDKAGNPAALPQADRLLAAVFDADGGGEIATLDNRQDGVIWLSVDKVTAARDRTLDEAKTDVTAAWMAAEKTRLTQAKATDLVAQLNGGKTLEQVAAAEKAEVKQAWSVKRQGQPAGLSGAAVNSVFATPVKGFGSAISATAGERLVFQVTSQIVPDFDAASAGATQVRQQQSATIVGDLTGRYVASVRDELGVTINEQNFNRVVGGSEN